MEFKRGELLLVMTATKEWVPRIALSDVMPGHKFPIVWVCRDKDWKEASKGGINPKGGAVPWPAEFVRLHPTERA